MIRLWHSLRSQAYVKDRESPSSCWAGDLAKTRRQHVHGCPSSPGVVESYVILKLDRDKQRQTYAESIDIKDVYKVASSHNMDKDCRKFRDPESGSFNVCFFVTFPSDGRKWVVRFPIGPVLHDPWQKIQSEIATLRYVKRNTTIPVPEVYGYGSGGSHNTNNPTGRPYLILEYIPGRPLDSGDLLTCSDDASRLFYSQLASILSQLRMQRFDYAGSLTADDEGELTVTSPHSIDLNSIQLYSGQQIKPCERHTSATDFACFSYQVLFNRLNQPVEMEEDDARHEVFALADYEKRLLNYVDSSSKHFVLTHGDLRPSNIIVGEDLTINAIIDWEWSCTVPRQFFIPPMWFAGNDVPLSIDDTYKLEYSKFHRALTDAAEDEPACRVLADEWSPDLSSSLDLYLPAALLRHDNFTEVYYKFLFPKYFKGVKRREKLREFYEEDGPSGIFSEAVRRKLEASQTYQQNFRDHC
ncbi:kinase-like domain-containing protein [Emericellopsis atlantica]|uniref:Kinase-like domain-containing protein n=1 Tax=Emericellopsis atlantica TaxID=2614577 RepID=A0A9P7ZIZ4_9HYPO|nr:kinase-like domain-containing protein [Emericellopsis atlantica]KAG9252587.1 kinase-like domain-containing protein [Emericellopsis atlantica]